MSIATILLPLFVQVALTLGLLLWLAALRQGDFRSRGVRAADIALREPNWPARTQQVAHSFSNQFELPVLFYVLTILAIVTRQADMVFVVLAWVFVLTRLVHAYVHTTSNVVMRRGGWFGIGAVVLIAMWLWFAVRILFGLP
jgi:hypothetical protein